MKTFHWIIVVFLIVTPVLLISYKSLVLHVPFIPKEEKNLWNVEIAVRVQPSPKTRKIGFPIPRQSDRVAIKNTQYDGKGMSLTIEKTTGGVRGHWAGKTSEKRTLYYKVTLDIQEKHYTLPSFVLPQHKEPRMKEYLSTGNLEYEEIRAIKKIEEETQTEQMNPVRAIKEIYYFIYEEILMNTRRQWKNLHEIAELAPRSDGPHLHGGQRSPCALPPLDRLRDRSGHPRTVRHATSGIWHAPRRVKQNPAKRGYHSVPTLDRSEPG